MMKDHNLTYGVLGFILGFIWGVFCCILVLMMG